jgi:hypothetical protein
VADESSEVGSGELDNGNGRLRHNIYVVSVVSFRRTAPRNALLLRRSGESASIAPFSRHFAAPSHAP